MATTEYLRRMNQRRIVETMARLGKASRVELSRVSGMSQPTVSRIVDHLLSSGVLTLAATVSGSAEPGAPAVGRPSTLLQLDTRKPRFGIVQVGARKTRLAALPIGFSDRDQWDREFDSPATVKEWTRQLAEAWEAYRGTGLKTIVVSLPGVVDEPTGQVLLSPNLRWTEQPEFAKSFKELFGRATVIFCQEIRALALGHMAMEPDAGDFLLVDSGRGLGAAAVAGGQLYRGPLPLSGELGHTPVIGNTRPCGCGSIGCSETLVSRSGMLASAVENGLPNDWPELLKTLAETPLPGWLKKTLDTAGVTIASALNVLGLRQVVLTGAFAELPAQCVTYLSEAIQADTMWARFGSVTCRTALRHRQAGMVSLAIDRTLFNARAAEEPAVHGAQPA